MSDTPTGERVAEAFTALRGLIDKHGHDALIGAAGELADIQKLAAPVQPVAETREPGVSAPLVGESGPEYRAMLEEIYDEESALHEFEEAYDGAGYCGCHLCQRIMPVVDRHWPRVVEPASRPIADKTFGELLDRYNSAAGYYETVLEEEASGGEIEIARSAFFASRAAVEAEYERVRGERDEARAYAVKASEDCVGMAKEVCELERRLAVATAEVEARDEELQGWRNRAWEEDGTRSKRAVRSAQRPSTDSAVQPPTGEEE